MGVLEAGDVELDCQQVVLVANRSRDFDGLATGGDHRMTSGQCCLGNVEAQATARAGDEPNLLIGHGMSFSGVLLPRGWAISMRQSRRPGSGPFSRTTV